MYRQWSLPQTERAWSWIDASPSHQIWASNLLSLSALSRPFHRNESTRYKPLRTGSANAIEQHLFYSILRNRSLVDKEQCQAREQFEGGQHVKCTGYPVPVAETLVWSGCTLHQRPVVQGHVNEHHQFLTQCILWVENTITNDTCRIPHVLGEGEPNSLRMVPNGVHD